MGCDENFMIMKLIWHSYLVYSLNNRTDKTPPETALFAGRWEQSLSRCLVTCQKLRAGEKKTQGWSDRLLGRKLVREFGNVRRTLWLQLKTTTVCVQSSHLCKKINFPCGS